MKHRPKRRTKNGIVFDLIVIDLWRGQFIEIILFSRTPRSKTSILLNFDLDNKDHLRTDVHRAGLTGVETIGFLSSILNAVFAAAFAMPLYSGSTICEGTPPSMV